MIWAVFDADDQANAYGLWQWDYGQVLQIQGLTLPPAVEIHFSTQRATGDSVTRIGVTRDGVTSVTIPDSMLEGTGTIYAFVYLTDEASGETIRWIKMPIQPRPKPEAFEQPEDVELFREAIKAVNEAADRADASEKEAEGWAHGRVDQPEREKDNAAFYAKEARDAVAGLAGQVVDAKAEIDQYVSEKEQDLKGDTGNVYFAAFKVVNGRLVMYSDPEIDRVRFVRAGSRLMYRLAF